MSKYSFWLLKPHQKPVSCQFELTEGTGVRLLRDSGGQLFKFTFEKIVKWNLGRDPNFLELQIQIGKTGPAGSLKFQVKDGTTTDDIRGILDVITRCKGGVTSQGEREQAKSTHEKTNVERKKEAADIQKQSKENLKKIQEERKQQQQRLQQANVTVSTPKKDSVELSNRMAHHKKSIQMKVERKRSFAVTAKEDASSRPPPPPPPKEQQQEKARRKKSSRASIYSLASSRNYEDDSGEEDAPAASKPSPPPPKPKPAMSAGKSAAARAKQRQPSGIIPQSRLSKSKPMAPLGLAAIGEDEGEEDQRSPISKREAPPPPPPQQSPKRASTASKGKPPPPPPPQAQEPSALAPAAQQPKKMSLVQARKSMYQQREEVAKPSPRSRSPSPKPPPPPRKAPEAAEGPDPAPPPPKAPPSPPPKRAASPPPSPPPKQQEQPAAPEAEESKKPAKRGSFMLQRVDASSQPDLAEAKSTINMLKVELQREKERGLAAEKRLEEAASELGAVKAKHDSASRERDAYLEECSRLKERVASMEGRQATGEGSADLHQENGDLKEENSNLLQSEALLLRSVMESSEVLGALRNRMWQVCEHGDQDGGEGEGAKAGDADEGTDADMSELRRTISSLERAVEAMEAEKMEREEKNKKMERKLSREKAQKKKMERQVKQEEEVVSALVSEAEEAATQGEDMRAMMEEFKRIAEERSEEVERLQAQKDQAMSELARVTRDHDLLRADVDEAVEKAVAEERTRSVAHLKLEVSSPAPRGRWEFPSLDLGDPANQILPRNSSPQLSKEKQKYESMLEDLLRDEEARSKEEESQAEQIEAQVAVALEENEKAVAERLRDLEEEFASRQRDLESRTAAAGASGQEAEALRAKCTSLERDLESKKAECSGLRERLGGVRSEIKVLSARTSSAYRAVESFVGQTTSFAEGKAAALLEKSEAFVAALEQECDRVTTVLGGELDEIARELNSRLPMVDAIEMSPSSTEATSAVEEEEEEGEETAESSPPKQRRQSRRKSKRASKSQKMATVDLSELPESLVGGLRQKEEPSAAAEEKEEAMVPARRESSVRRSDLDRLSQEISQKVREELRESRVGEEETKRELEQAREALEAMEEECDRLRRDAAGAKKKEEEADLVCAAVEAQCRTLALELAAQKLDNASAAMEAEEDVLVMSPERRPHAQGAPQASPLERGGGRLVVPVDVVRDTLPHYSLLELGDQGMKLGQTEVALSRKAEWDFPWDRVNQITVGIADEYVSLDLFEHANAEAAHLRIRDARHLNTVLTVITRKRIEAALAATSYATGARAEAAGSGEGLDFGLNVTRVYQDPGEVAASQALALASKLAEGGPGAAIASSASITASTTMSPAVVRISSVSRGLARTHDNLKRRLLHEGLTSQLRASPQGGSTPVKIPTSPDVTDVAEESAGNFPGEFSEDAVRMAEEETERERSLCTKVASLEAVRNDLVHKLATLRVNAVNAVMQSHNVVKFLAAASREDMASKLGSIESASGAEGAEGAALPRTETGAFDAPSWDPVSDSVKSLLAESAAWSAADFAEEGDSGFSFGMEAAEREAFLVAQAEAELTQSAVSCLEQLWGARVKRVEEQLKAASEKGQETQEHESTLLQDLASARAQVSSLQEELSFSKRELGTLKHVYESQEAVEAAERQAAIESAGKDAEKHAEEYDAEEGGEDVDLVQDGLVEEVEEIGAEEAVPAATSSGRLPKALLDSAKTIIIKPRTYDYKAGRVVEEPVAKAEGEGQEDSEPRADAKRELIVANYDEIQSRQQQLSLEVSEAVENLKYIDERLSDLDKAANVVGDRVESYFKNLETMEETYDRNKHKLGEIEQEIFEQDAKIAEVKASVGRQAVAAEGLGTSAPAEASPVTGEVSRHKKTVTFAPIPIPLVESNENVAAGVATPEDPSYLSFLSTPKATTPAPTLGLGTGTPPGGAPRGSLSVKAKKLESVVQNIINML